MNDFTVLRNGKRIEIPREIEAAGGKAIEAHVRTHALPDVLALNVAGAAAEIRLIESADDLDRLHAIERANPEFMGGRKGVLDAIEERRGELAIADDTT